MVLSTQSLTVISLTLITFLITARLLEVTGDIAYQLTGASTLKPCDMKSRTHPFRRATHTQTHAQTQSTPSPTRSSENTSRNTVRKKTQYIIAYEDSETASRQRTIMNAVSEKHAQDLAVQQFNVTDKELIDVREYSQAETKSEINTACKNNS